MPARASQALATMLVLLVTCIGPVVASAQPQPAPTPDATIVALNKEKLNQEVEQLKAQNDFVSAMLRSLSPVFIPVVAVAVGALRWREDRKNERDKRDEERFQDIVAGLGSEMMQTRTVAAVMLRTFLPT